MSQRARRREKLWRRDARCRRCGIPTVLPPTAEGHRKAIPENEATIQHLDSRLSSHRGLTRGAVERTTLWCRKCNHADGKAENDALPVAEKWARSGRLPLSMRPTSTTSEGGTPT